MLGREHSGKVSKKFIGKFYFWGINLSFWNIYSMCTCFVVWAEVTQCSPPHTTTPNWHNYSPFPFFTISSLGPISTCRVTIYAAPITAVCLFDVFFPGKTLTCHWLVDIFGPNIHKKWKLDCDWLILRKECMLVWSSGMAMGSFMWLGLERELRSSSVASPLKKCCKGEYLRPAIRSPTAFYNKQSLGPLPLEQQTVAMTTLAW